MEENICVLTQVVGEVKDEVWRLDPRVLGLDPEETQLERRQAGTAWHSGMDCSPALLSEDCQLCQAWMVSH